MKKHAFLSLVGITLIATLPGCGRGMMGPALFGLRVATTAALVAAVSQPRVVVVEESVPSPVLVPIGAPDPLPATPAAATAPGFDPVAASTAVDAVDASSCWPGGSARGYGRVRVTFNPGGKVDLVELVNPVPGAPVDGQCLSQKYGAVQLPAFSGGPVAVRASFYVG